eukprot:13934943-Alexandrium_andersonii.AAC.1
MVPASRGIGSRSSTSAAAPRRLPAEQGYSLCLAAVRPHNGSVALLVPLAHRSTCLRIPPQTVHNLRSQMKDVYGFENDLKANSSC